MAIMRGRRMFLTGAGGCLLALPFLPSLLSRTSRAQVPAGSPRFVTIKSYSTQIIRDWYPSKTANGYQLRDALYGGSKADGTTYLPSFIPGTQYGVAPLSDFSSGGLSTILSDKLSPYADQMNLLRGVDYLPDTNHNDGGILGNYASTVMGGASASLPHVATIDQVMAYSPKVYPDPPAVRSLHLSPGGQNSISFTNYGDPQGTVEQVQAHLDPRTAWNEVFGMFMPPDPTKQVDPNLALVDRVYDDYVTLKKNKRLSKDDKDMLERHIGFLAELESQLENGSTPGAQCMPPDEPTSYPNEPPYADLGNVDDIRRSYELMMDIMAAALMCGQTRIATLDVRKALSTGRGSEFGYFHGADNPGSWHGDAHAWGDTVAQQNLVVLNTWIAEEIFLGVLERLDVPEADTGRTYLENSVVYWGNELGFNHIAYSVPALLAGSAAGFLKTGNYIDYIDWDGQAFFSQENGNVILGIPHNQLLVTLLQAMGLQPSDYELGGQPGYGSTSLTGKDPQLWATDYDLSKIGDPLPGLVA